MVLNEKGKRLLTIGCDLMDKAAKLVIEKFGEDCGVGWGDAEDYDLDKTPEEFVGLLLYAQGENALNDALSWCIEDDNDRIYYGGSGNYVAYGELKTLLRSCYE